MFTKKGLIQAAGTLAGMFVLLAFVMSQPKSESFVMERYLSDSTNIEQEEVFFSTALNGQYADNQSAKEIITSIDQAGGPTSQNDGSLDVLPDSFASVAQSNKPVEAINEEKEYEETETIIGVIDGDMSTASVTYTDSIYDVEAGPEQPEQVVVTVVEKIADESQRYRGVDEYYYVNEDTPLYESDDSSSEKLGSLEYAEKVHVIGMDPYCEDGFCKVEVDGQEYYIEEQVLTDEILFTDAEETVYAEDDIEAFEDPELTEKVADIEKGESIDVIGKAEDILKISLEDETAYISDENVSESMVFEEDETKVWFMFADDLKAEPSADAITLWTSGTNDAYVRVGISDEWSKLWLPDGEYGYVQNSTLTTEEPEISEIVVEEEVYDDSSDYEYYSAIDSESSGSGSSSTSRSSSAEQQSSQSETTQSRSYTSGSYSSLGEEVIEYAKQFIGNPYVWGGESLTNGCDCSGFVMLVYRHFGVSLPHYSGSQRNVGYAVSESDMQPGDIVCYEGHVGLYAGNGQIINASNSKPYPAGGIKYSSVYCKPIVCVRRIF